MTDPKFEDDSITCLRHEAFRVLSDLEQEGDGIAMMPSTDERNDELARVVGLALDIAAHAKTLAARAMGLITEEERR